jgi:hypothetical protein
MKTKFVKGDLVKSVNYGTVVEVESCNKTSFAGTVKEVGSDGGDLGKWYGNWNLDSFEKISK